MPSNQTPNYQLSQWEAGDRVQRADFNADNAKIDAALNGLAARVAVLEGQRPVELGRKILTGSETKITFPLADANVTRFRRLRLWTPELGCTSGQIVVQVNGVDSGYSYDGVDTLNPITQKFVHFLSTCGVGSMSICPLSPAGTLFYTESVGISHLSGHWGWSTQKAVPYSGLTKLEVLCLESSSRFAAGGEVVLYGMFD